MATTAYNLHLKGYVGGADFDRNAVDRTLAANSGKRVNVLIDSLGGFYSIEYLGNFEERYQGEYKTMEDFAEYIVSELYNLDSIMGHLSCYFDYEKYGRDLECDYTLEDGYVF